MSRYPYPSDLSDKKWHILEPLIIPGLQAGHPQVVELRRVVDAVFYMLRTGCQWRALPHEFPPWTGVLYHYANARTKNLGADQHGRARAASPSKRAQG